MKLALPDSISSAQDLNALSLEIRGYARWAAHQDIKQRVGAKSRGGEAPVLTPAADDLLRAWGDGKPLGPRRLDELAAALRATADSAPSLTITLAAPPAAGLKKQLVAWCRANISADVLVSFQFSSALLGGMVVRSGSHIYDWSFRRQILAARGDFPRYLRGGGVPLQPAEDTASAAGPARTEAAQPASRPTAALEKTQTDKQEAAHV